MVDGKKANDGQPCMIIARCVVPLKESTTEGVCAKIVIRKIRKAIKNQSGNIETARNGETQKENMTVG